MHTKFCWKWAVSKRLQISALYFLIFSASLLSAFPPAPAITYFGTVRDSFGNSIDSSAGAFVVIRSGERIITETPINERFRAGESYRALVPVDLAANDPYSEEASDRGALLSFSVRLAGSDTLIPVSGISVGNISVTDPGDRLRVDFFLGVDSDGDGLPDDWELSQLELAGISPSDSRFSLSTLNRNGDFDSDGLSNFTEYVAGTFALLQGDRFALKLISVSEETDRLETNFVFGKRYQFEASSDFTTWYPARVQLVDSTSSAVAEIAAADDGTTQLDAVRPEELSSATSVFYRMSVR